jgi:hypothetical protein
MMNTRPFLVITRAGSNSLHRKWIEGTESRNFDLLITEYESSGETPRTDGVEKIHLAGTKIAGYLNILTTRPELFLQYTHIALVDDDILMNCDQINECFRVGKDNQLQLWQPSLSWDSYFSYAATLHVPFLKLRYTNYVEMMCPFFSSRYLQQALPLFSLGFETGIDLMWTRLQKNNLYQYAIIDGVIAKHTKPVGRVKEMQGFSKDYSYDDEIEIVLNKFNITFLGPVTYGAVLSNGITLKSRLVVFMYALMLIFALRKSPIKEYMRARIFDHWRHIILRPINNKTVTVDPSHSKHAPPKSPVIIAKSK